MVKGKEGCSGCCIVECWHSFGPFSEIVNHHDYIFVVTSRWRLTFHKVNGPFAKRASCDDRMEGSGRSSRLGGEMLAIGTVFDCFNAIIEERRPKIPNAHDFLGSSRTEEVATTSTAMIGIEDLFFFSVCETTTKDIIYTATIKVVIDKKVVGGLVSDTSSSITVKMEGELLSSQISEDVPIPRVIIGNIK